MIKGQSISCLLPLHSKPTPGQPRNAAQKGTGVISEAIIQNSIMEEGSFTFPGEADCPYCRFYHNDIESLRSTPKTPHQAKATEE